MTAHQNDQPTPSDEWRPATGNEVSGLARHLRGRQRRRRFLQACGGVAAGLLTAGGLWWLVGWAARPREYDFGGITCSEVAARTDALRDGRLPQAEVARVEAHVRLCPTCRPMFERTGALKLFGWAKPVCGRSGTA